MFLGYMFLLSHMNAHKYLHSNSFTINMVHGMSSQSSYTCTYVHIHFHIRRTWLIRKWRVFVIGPIEGPFFRVVVGPIWGPYLYISVCGVPHCIFFLVGHLRHIFQVCGITHNISFLFLFVNKTCAIS